MQGRHQYGMQVGSVGSGGGDRVVVGREEKGKEGGRGRERENAD